MSKIKVDLLRAKYQLDRQQNKRGIFFFARVFLILLVITAMTGVAFSYEISTNSDVASIGFFSSLKRLVLSGDRGLEGKKDDRINFLLLGVGGAGHDGPELSDTIIFASLKPSTNQVGMLSIPRDMTVPIPGYEWRKINNVNAFGELQEKGSGPKMAADVIGDLLDQDIHYYIKVNFNGFEELIDELGGVEVYVDRSFSDYSYPTDNHLTETIHFEQGWQKMDGKTALKFARSRHGNNAEGSDFARAARQQKIILAVKDKLLSTSTLLNPARMKKLYETISENLNTNLSVLDMLSLATYVPDINDDDIKSHVLDASPESPLYATNINGAYVLLPKNDDWRPVKRLAANVFNDTNSKLDLDTPPTNAPHFVKVEIQNGTSISGLAFNASQLLESSGFEVTKIGNAAEREYDHTVVYDLTNGQKSKELNQLKSILEADVSMSAAGWVFTNEIVPTELTVSDAPGEEMATKDNIDFLVILGKNTANLVMR